MYVPRHLQPTLIQALDQFPAVLLTGPRQSGKTTFLLRELGEGSDYVTFDDPLERDFARDDPNGFLDRFEGRVILDEVQYVPRLMEYLKIRIDRDRERNGRWLLTGSQRFQLMAGVSESLAGRVAILELLPLSLPELTQARQPDLAQIVWNGLYPDPALQPAKRDLWVGSYLQTYVERDVRQLHNVQDLSRFETFLTLCAARHSQELNVSALGRDAGISSPTAKTWIGILEAAYVLLRLPPYFENYGKRLVKSPKVFFLDPALACSLTRQPGAQAALAGAFGGPLFEGMIVAEAAKAFTVRGRRPDLYFWRSHDGLEVDLLLRAEQRLWPIEIKLTATPSVRHLESMKRFVALGGEDVAPGVLVCRASERQPMPGGFTALPWQEFPDWLGQRLDGDKAPSPDGP